MQNIPSSFWYKMMFKMADTTSGEKHATNLVKGGEIMTVTHHTASTKVKGRQSLKVLLLLPILL